MQQRFPSALSIVGLLAMGSLHAQSPDPTGHWQGTIQAPDHAVNLEIDLAKNATGEFAGTIGIPEESVKGLPLQKVSVEGQSLTLVARSDQPFTATLSPDGKSLSGSLSVSGFSVPVSLVRMGDAQIEPREKSAPIRKELEGTWKATLNLEGQQYRIVLTMSNQPDGTATGLAVDLDEGGLQVPVTVAETDSNVNLRFKAIDASFTGALNREGSELAGTYRHGTIVAPLNFEHAK